ncbi:Holliday junction branch migration protein RuvA [Helicobacter sp. MIT 14-3879]|uniref:Holliday junction branch migration protein RuvA n=1 Tax=Helicobacter sp. MIT 14-3879 TaxID=2040649 RepID=UPI000E1FB2BC|nr:Holliday junction branch migration protein RuvA [Helicobacter sp. MIT 14-3879]RDU63143.1 Holliday junction branch migration protein RuvA [Helicobacter sp. MIT 14-3879]
MIAGLIGNVYQKNISNVLFNVNGVIYEINMSLKSISKIKENDTLLITQIIREDSINLYGFLDKDEKNLFDNLIKINGIGPKVAISICSSFNPNEFISIANSNDFNTLKKVPGIGEKMAKRIIVEISGKIVVDDSNLSSNKRDAINAMEILGFKNTDILKALENIESNNTEEIIKEALKKLQK